MDSFDDYIIMELFYIIYDTLYFVYYNKRICSKLILWYLSSVLISKVNAVITVLEEI